MVQNKKKILVIRYRFIGDTVLLVPFLRNLRKAEPEAQIDLTVNSLTYPILKNCPYVDNFVFADKNRWKQYKQTIKENKYTEAYILKRSFSAAWSAFCSGIKNRIGFDTECRGFLLTKRIKYKKDEHESQTFLDVLRAQGFEVDSGYLELFEDNEAERKTKDLLKDISKNIVVVHATSSNSKKQWGLDNQAKIVEYLTNVKKAQVVFLGAPEDEDVYKSIVAKCRPLETEPLNFCGKISLSESISVIGKAKLLVGCDSGNLHVAAALGVPVIGIYGPMSAKKWRALGENNTILFSNEKCYPCALKKKCKNNYRCLTSITPTKVIEAIDKYKL